MTPLRVRSLVRRAIAVLLSVSLCHLRWSLTRAMGFDGIPGDYCKTRYPSCCPTRDDDCTAPILGNHRCYCDMFCNRRPDGDDCCPDFKYVCGGARPDESRRGCTDDQGNAYPAGTHKINCNSCTCSDGRLQCDAVACLIQPDILAKVNEERRYTWRALNYSEFWGQTLDDGVRYRLGTLFPTRTVQNMNDILIEPSPNLPERFDAREKWPNYIHPVRDQGNCGASWAFSTTAVSSDRLAIQSEGKFNLILSPQQVISCNQHRQDGCTGGHLDRAWWYLRKLGGTTEECYPYASGRTNDPGSCLIDQSAYRRGEVSCPSGSSENRIHKMTPPYKISSKEEEIKDEIFRNGPVQATFLVHEDFYIYGGGVYQHLNLAASKPEQYRRSAYHSVRILGWGVDHSEGRPVKYWLCANSWGTSWGENGLFRILRGENHCEIETFVLGAWGKGSRRRRRRRRRLRIRKAKRFTDARVIEDVLHRLTLF